MSSKESFQLKLQDATVDVERLGELFLMNREQMISTDRQRNSNREALTALRKHHGASKVWMYQSSNSFERCSTPGAVDRLEAEAARLETVMSELRSQQKQLLALLADKGVTAQGLEDGMLRALLQLKG